MKNLSLIHYGAIIILLLCSADFAMRLTPTTDTKNSLPNLGIINQLDVIFLSQESAAVIQQALDKFDIEPIVVEKKKTTKKKNEKPKISLMSAEKQRLQSGQLSVFFDGEDKYQLIATFYDSKKRFVLLKKEHLPSKKITSIKLLEGEMLAAYKLEKIDRDFIVFSEQKRTIELQLFTKKST